MELLSFKPLTSSIAKTMTWAEYVSTKPAGNATVVIGLTYGNSNFTEDFPRKASSQGNTSSTNTPLAAKASKAYACHDQQMYKISIYQNWGKDMSGHTVEMIFEKMPADDVAFSQCTPRAPVLEEGAFECNMTNTTPLYATTRQKMHSAYTTPSRLAYTRPGPSRTQDYCSPSTTGMCGQRCRTGCRIK